MSDNSEHIPQTNLKLRPEYRKQLEGLQKHHREHTNPAMSMTFVMESLIAKEYKRLKLSDKEEEV